MKNNASGSNNTTYLEVREVSKSFGGLMALDRASVNLEKGRITGLIGPNGAGKTTLFNILTGFLPADGGDVFYKGEKITNLPPVQLVRRGICRTFQDLRLFYGLSVLDNVAVSFPYQQGEGLLHAIFGGRAQERQNRGKALALLELVGLADRPTILVEDLSVGQQRLVCLARLLAADADVLFLDEPTAHVSSSAIERMFSLIKDLAAQGKTICIVEHNIELVLKLCDYVYCLHMGQNLTEGLPQEVVRNPKVLRVYLGVEEQEICKGEAPM